MYFNSSVKLKMHPSRERKNVKVSEVRDNLEDRCRWEDNIKLNLQEM
jgi:hypothetical protein